MDVKEAIDVLQTEIKFQGYVETSMILEAHRMAIKALERTQWIPVSERLPDGDVASVMIYTESGGVAEGQYYPTIKAWKQFRWSVENANVTHWMPLPKLPEV